MGETLERPERLELFECPDRESTFVGDSRSSVEVVSAAVFEIAVFFERVA